MIPKIWKRSFRRIGWEPQWLGPESTLPPSGLTVRAGRVPVNRSIHKHLNSPLGTDVLNFGRDEARMIRLSLQHDCLAYAELNRDADVFHIQPFPLFLAVTNERMRDLSLKTQ
jgi:hypothetical protein